MGRKQVGAVVLAVCLASSVAMAQRSGGGDTVRSPGGLYDRSPQKRDQMISVFATLPFAYGFGIGAGGRYTLPFAPDGILPEINESFEAEFGLDFFYRSWGAFGFNYSWMELLIPAEVRWTFHVLPKLDVYAKLGLGYGFGFGASGSFGTAGPTYGGFWWNTASGVLYQISKGLHLRGELGVYGLRAGLGWEF